MNVSNWMKRDVVSITATETIGQAAALIVSRHVGTLPVTDGAGKLMGILQIKDLLMLVMPDFVRLLEDYNFVHDFGAVEHKKPPSPEVLAQPVETIMEPPIFVEEGCGLLRAAAFLRQQDLSDLPVVDSAGRLVGIASRVDIGVALLASWPTTPETGGQ